MRGWLLFTYFVMLAAPTSGGTPPIRSTKPNIIFITIDTLRADHVGCYGATGVSTPTLDSLARDGILFERAIAQVPLTFPSHASMMTGLYPFQNGAQEFTSPPLDSRFRTLAQALHEHGYATGAVVSSFALDHSWGLARGFDFYDDAFSQESYRKRELGLVQRGAEESVSHALEWLKKTSKRPFFLWLHLYDPHSPYDPPEPFETTFAGSPYDGEVAYADQQLGRIIAWLKRASLYGNALVIATSDHGESLGDHGEKEHGFFVYDSTLRVPLVIKPPVNSGVRNGRIEDVVEIVRIPSTILRLLGLTDPITKVAAPALFSLSDHSYPAYSETFYPFSSFGWSPLHSLHSGRFHFIDAPTSELYDVTADPSEKNNLAPSQSATMAVLRAKLRTILEKQSPSRPRSTELALSPEAQEKLQALGYFAFRSPVPQSRLLGQLPDPKSKLLEFNSLLEAQDAIHAGEYERGRSLLNAVREKDPEMYIVSFYLGSAASGQKRWEEAATEFRRCLELSPGFEQAMTGLARALTFLGESDEARKWAQKALEISPQSYQALYELGFLEANRNRGLAIQYYEKAVAVQPNYAALQRDLGTLQLQEANFPESAKHLEKAIELGLSDSSILNSLGLAYGRTQRLSKAVDTFKKALILSPDAAEIHLNLAAAYTRLGRADEATAEYGVACNLNARYCR